MSRRGRLALAVDTLLALMWRCGSAIARRCQLAHEREYVAVTEWRHGEKLPIESAVSMTLAEARADARATETWARRYTNRDGETVYYSMGGLR